MKHLKSKAPQETSRGRLTNGGQVFVKRHGGACGPTRCDSQHPSELVIIEAAKGGMSKAEVRKMLGVAGSTVSQIWKHLRSCKPVTSR